MKKKMEIEKRILVPEEKKTLENEVERETMKTHESTINWNFAENTKASVLFVNKEYTHAHVQKLKQRRIREASTCAINSLAVSAAREMRCRS